MTFKRIVRSCIAFCIAAILAIAACGCEDLGEYSSIEEYYASLGDVVLIDGTGKRETKYSVEEYFYNKDSQENFLKGEDGAYRGVSYDDYVYVAIPFESDIDMDALALFLQSEDDVTVYINAYITRAIPSNIKGINDVGKEYETEIVYRTEAADTSESLQQTEALQETVTVDNAESTGSAEYTAEIESADVTESAEESTIVSESTSVCESTSADESTSAEETDVEYETVTEIIKIEYNDPDPNTRIGEVTVKLRAGEWTSFTLNSFVIGGETKNSVEIRKGQYILLQIRNNSGIRVFDETTGLYLDSQTGKELGCAYITMTNLMIRALNVVSRTD